MTRKRFVNLMRAICTECAKESPATSPNAFKGWEKCWRNLPGKVREAHKQKNGKSYEELFEIPKPLAQKFGIGGY